MRKLGRKGVAVALLIVFVLAGLLSVVPALPAASSASVRVTVSPVHASAAPTVAASVGTHGTARPLASLTFPRTVLIETFTGVWCPHCPTETQALHTMDLTSSKNVLAISELHVCAFGQGTSPCYDNYPAPDNTTYTRGAWYNVCGYPHVFFDGQHGVCGASDVESQMLAEYQSNFRNASNVPGNVSITETALLSYQGASFQNATVQASITSGVTGTYNVVSYLMEFIGKQNQSYSSGPHDVDWVVRSTLHNHPLYLTAGGTVQLSYQGAILPTWNTRNLSVVTFVQENSTKIVQNANFAPLTSELARISDNLTTVNSGANSTVTVHVTNSTTGSALNGATVNFLSDNGGSFTPASAVTDASGTATTTFTAPSVSSAENVTVSAGVTAPGYTADTVSTTLVINPLVPPTVPRNFGVLPGVGQVTLNWTAPTTGGGGVTYLVYQSLARGGPYTVLTAVQTTNYTYTGLVAGQVLWFEVASQDTGGVSAKTAPLSATSVAVTPTGLMPNNGWWITFGLTNFSSATGSSMTVFLPVGPYDFAFGAASKWIVPIPGVTSSIVVASAPLTVTVAFGPKPATLEGTVSPASANVAFNGTPLSVSGGSFTWVSTPGTFPLVASHSGYTTNSTTVKLTAGNTTVVHLQLQLTGSSTGALSSPTFGFLGSDPVTIVALAAIIVVVAVLATVLVVQQRRKRGSAPPPSEPEPEYAYGQNPPQ